MAEKSKQNKNLPIEAFNIQRIQCICFILSSIVLTATQDSFHVAHHAKTSCCARNKTLGYAKY